MEKWHVLNGFIDKTNCSLDLMFLFLFYVFNSYVLSFVPMNCTTLKFWKTNNENFSVSNKINAGVWMKCIYFALENFRAFETQRIVFIWHAFHFIFLSQHRVGEPFVRSKMELQRKTLKIETKLFNAVMDWTIIKNFIVTIGSSNR